MPNNRFTLTSYEPLYVTAPEVRIPEEDVKKQAIRWLELNACKDGEKPQLNDEWVTSHVEDLDGVDHLMSFVRFNMYKNNTEVQKLADQDAICAELAKRLVEDVPEAIVEESVYAAHIRFEDMLRRQGMTLESFCAERHTTPEQVDEDLKSRAVQSLREDSALEAWADKQNYTLEPDDFYAVIPGDSIEDKARKRRQIEMDGRLAGLEQYALKTKALNEITANCMIRRNESAEYVRYGDVSGDVQSAYNEYPENFIL